MFRIRKFSAIPPRFRRSALALLAVTLLPVMLLGWPLHALEIRRLSPDFPEGEAPTVFHTSGLLGRSIQASIIHSLQLTPVIDEYRIQEGRLCAWQEKIMTHNAGLPSLRPERGRFVYDPPWMIVEGTGESWERIHYRVGTGDLGKNELCFFPLPCRELWREMPGTRLIFQIAPSRLSL